MTLPFVSLTDLGLFVEQDLSQSALAIIALDSACEAIRTELNQTVNLVTDDEVTLDGTGRASLLLPQIPVRSVSVVVTDPGDDDELTIDVDDYIVDGAGILWRLDWGKWPMGHQNIAVTYTHGWDMTETVQDVPADPGVDTIVHVPSDIRMVALQLAAEVLIAGKVGVGGVTQESIGDQYSYTVGTGEVRMATLSIAHRDMLARYRIDP